MSGVCSIYCLACRSRQDVDLSALSIVETSFKSKKNQKPMTRSCYVGTCPSCGKPLRQFTKSKAPEAPDVPEAPEIEEAPHD